MGKSIANQRSVNGQFKSSAGVKLETILFVRIERHTRALLEAFCKQRHCSLSAAVNDAIRAHVRGTLIDDDEEDAHEEEIPRISFRTAQS
jgi:hypothetical protein